MENGVKALNNYVKNGYGLTGSFVGYKSYIVDKRFSIMRHYKLCLDYINNGITNPIIEETITLRSDDINLEKIINIKFLEAIYDYIDSDEFKDLVDGKLGI